MPERGAHGPWDRGHGFRPPWWPEGEPFPPRGPMGWGGVGPGFRRRMIVGFVAIFAFAVVLATIAVQVATGVIGGAHPARPLAVVVLFALVAGGVALGRTARRTVAPIADVMDAADRVARGDYAVRVEPRGSREARRLAASFNAMTERLQTDEARRRELLADVAHELRTPLSVIRGQVEAMLDGVHATEPSRLRPLLEEAIVMDRLLEDLRTLSMAEAGALRLHREPVDAGALVEDAVDAFRSRAEEAGIRLASSAEEAMLEADPVRIAEVLGNLVSNAIRHTGAGGRVTVSSRRRDGEVVFEVADTGSGIASEDLTRVFDRFVRSADSGGSGLGLAIAKRLVEAHGGTIEDESGPAGTTMRFAVPATAR